MPRYVGVTGCCGFIGKHVTRKLLERGDYVYGIDSLTYAADPNFPSHAEALGRGRFSFVGRDIRELGRWPDVDGIIHLAAETHVDNSLLEAARFLEVNVLGTHHLLEMTLAKRQHGMPRFIYISTDEVYGPIVQDRAYPETPLRPSSPYAASKAAADLLVQAYGTTYDLPYTILRPTNVYGCGQHPEKLIPKAVRSLLLERPIPIHGDGSQTRCWLWVEDLADAILYALDHAETLPPIANVGGNVEAAVGSIVGQIKRVMGGNHDWVEYGYERPGCDMRYAVDDSALRQHGWKPQGDFWAQLPALVQEESRRFRF